MQQHSSSSDDFTGLPERELDSGSSEPSPEEEDKEADDVESESRIKRRRGDDLESGEETNGSTLQVLLEQNSEASAMCAHPGSFGDLYFVCGQRLIEQSGVTFGYILKRGKIIRQKFVHDYKTLVT